MKKERASLLFSVESSKILNISNSEPNSAKGAFVWDQSGIRIIGIMQVSVRLVALPIPEYLDFHSGYSAPRSRIAGIYSGIYSHSRIFPNERERTRTNASFRYYAKYRNHYI